MSLDLLWLIFTSLLIGVGVVLALLVLTRICEWFSLTERRRAIGGFLFLVLIVSLVVFVARLP